MKKFTLILGCILLSGGLYAASSAATSAPASTPRIEDISSTNSADGEIDFYFSTIAQKISQNPTDKWVIFKFYEDEAQHNKTKAADRAIFNEEYNENAAEIAKLYRVNLAHATVKIINKYNRDVNNGPMYVCYEVQERDGGRDEDFVDSCHDEGDVHFGTEANAIPHNIEYILRGKNDLPPLDDE